jgi:hypothetical protein
MFMLIFVAMWLFALTAAGAVTDRWAAHTSNSATTDRPHTTSATVSDHRTTLDAARTRRRGPTRIDASPTHHPGRVADLYDPPRLVLVDSGDDARRAARQVARRHHPAGQPITSGVGHTEQIWDRDRSGRLVLLRPKPPTTPQSA